MSSSSSSPSHSPSAVPGGGVGGSVVGERMKGEVARPKASALEGLAMIETGNGRRRPSRRACVLWKGQAVSLGIWEAKAQRPLLRTTEDPAARPWKAGGWRVGGRVLMSG